jgi:endoglucanase
MRISAITATFFLMFAMATDATSQVPFKKGVNLTNWFQTSSAKQIQFTKFTRQDFVNIKNLGCDVVRLPINLHYMTNGAPAYTIDPIFFMFLDSAVTWVESLHIYLLLDNHSFDPNVNTDPNIGVILKKVWGQMANHYKDRSSYILYEVLNEPHGLTTQVWGQIQQSVIDTIRTIDTKHTIVVGASGYNSYNELANLPVYSDPNLLYTFHFYDPFMFTHQGASWVLPSMIPLAGVPFPYDAAKMPVCPTALKGTWVESSLNNYMNDGTVAKVKSLIDVAVNFRTARNVNIFCGEFGVYMLNSSNDDRVLWYDTVRNYLEKKGIPWTMWDYKGGFGLFKKGSNEMFDYDLNIPLVQALGMNVPPQKTYVLRPDSVGFPVYSDFIEKNILESSYAPNATIDFYSTTLPNNGRYCIYTNGFDQYNQVGFDFVPDKDLSVLRNNNYAIDFMVRGDSPGSSFDIRFLDKKTTQVDGHPWRMGATVNETMATWNKKWYHVRIPLSSLIDEGAWDSIWYNPQGKFDWTIVDRLEIVAEQSNLNGKSFWFDNITISNQDTAKVYENTTVGISSVKAADDNEFRIYPNPFNEVITIEYCVKDAGYVEIDLYNNKGVRVHKFVNKVQAPGTYSVTWNPGQANQIKLPDGLYICSLNSSGTMRTLKVVKQ